ncbi:MAG TPA: peptidoglycan-binding protein [Streptosporangiaceae bacterium]|nr:peptidoglycan-binding protein [Streptosporangiaceae bacterium]
MGVNVLDDKPGSGRLRRRRVILLVVIGLAVIASIGGLLISTTIKSPAQQAAETKAPGLTRLTAPVQDTVIRNTVQADGLITKPPQISSLSSGGGGGAAGGNAQQVVTKIFHPPGSFVAPGNVIIEVAGRPFFVLEGSVPAYRDMAPGESGSDITQLQAGLEALGFGIGGDTSGTYGPGTSAAVAAFYQGLGYTAPAAPAGTKGHRGTEVPLSEIMFVPRLPAQVIKLGGHVGSVVSGSLVTLSLGSPSVKGQLNPAFGSLVRPGMKVTITTQGSPATVHATIASVSRKAQTSKSISGGLYYPMHIKLHKPLPSSMGPGQNVILSIQAAHSNGPMLAVPEAALFGGQDGKDYVSKVTGPDSTARIQVTVVTEGDGLVGIRPDRAGALKPGDQVVTGENYLTSPNGRTARKAKLVPAGGSGSITVVGPG